jgi:hypothetical protein
MLSSCLVGAMFNTEYKILVSTVLLKNEFYWFINISYSNISVFLYHQYIDDNTSMCPAASWGVALTLPPI